MSNTLEGAKSMVLAQRESGKLLQIGHQRRSNPRYRFVLDRFLNKAELCGRIVNVNGQWNRSLSKSQDITIKKASLMVPSEKLKQYGYQNMHEFPETGVGIRTSVVVPFPILGLTRLMCSTGISIPFQPASSHLVDVTISRIENTSTT